MKRVIQFATILLFVLAGCVREQVDPTTVPQMTIRVTIPSSPVSKASFSVPGSGEGLHLAWQDGDKIRVIDEMDEMNNAEFNILPGFTDHVAQFSGPVISGDDFVVICPGTYTSIDEAEAGDPTLTQNGNGSTEHLVFTAMLSGVTKDDLSEIDFNQEWADDHGAYLFRGGIVKLILTLPDAVTAPKKVEMSIEDEGVPVLSRSLNITGVSLASEHVLTAYLQSSWEDKDFTDITVKVTDGDGSVYTATRNAGGSLVTMMAGYQNIINMPGGGNSFVEEPFAGGDGTQASPYLLSTAKHLGNMHLDGVLKHGERVYFRMIRDIDMESYLQSNTWLPLNSLTPYDYLIDFDGDGHTIDNFSCTFDATGLADAAHDAASKPSFFGLLYGSCYDVNFTNASITTNHGTAGILGGYIGYSGKKAVVYNVHVQGTITRTTSNGDTGCGGLGGRIVYSYIDSSSADVVIDCPSRAYTGGLFGIDQGDASRIRNCWTSGTINGEQRVGGICGGILRPETEIINCFSTATVNALRCGGGIAGHCNLDNGTIGTFATLYPDNVIKGCIAWQTTLATRTQNKAGNSYWSSGAIAAYTATHNYLVDCYHHPNLSFSDYTPDFTLYDQENASPSSALSLSNPNESTYKHYAPYHGKAADAGKTLSQVAKQLGWDETVWDLSGSIPVLTGAVQVDSPSEIPSSGNANVPASNSFARAFPTNGSVKDGLTYDVTEVQTGIKYYHGIGTCSANWMDSGTRKQEVYVVDLDLSSTLYDVKVVVASSSVATSTAFTQTGAIAAINGAYEKASVAIKGNMFLDTSTGFTTNYPIGYPYSYAPNNTIGKTGVDNWKNEGTFYSDGHRGVRIAFDAYEGGSTDKYGSGTTVKDVKYMRKFYKQCTDSEPGFISSAPMLDANYTRFGYTFKDRCDQSTANYTYQDGDNTVTENSERPKVHQSGAYPRTAVAIAYPNGDSGSPHLLLIVCDGRYDEDAGAYGMSAYWLERLIANHFAPKYMLNLDGGGSSTMCVKNKGDESTHVVNYPCDNRGSNSKIHDHAGERARDTFIVIVPAQ